MANDKNNKEDSNLARHNADLDQDEGNMNHGTVGGSMGEMGTTDDKSGKDAGKKSTEESQQIQTDKQ